MMRTVKGSGSPTHKALTAGGRERERIHLRGIHLMAWPLPVYELALMTAARDYDMREVGRVSRGIDALRYVDLAVLKNGGIAAQQADTAAQAIAALAGVTLEPKPFHPVIRGILLTGDKPRYLKGSRHRMAWFQLGVQRSPDVDTVDQDLRPSTLRRTWRLATVPFGP
jgi:hypothetical protein